MVAVGVEREDAHGQHARPVPWALNVDLLDVLLPVVPIGLASGDGACRAACCGEWDDMVNMASQHITMPYHASPVHDDAHDCQRVSTADIFQVFCTDNIRVLATGFLPQVFPYSCFVCMRDVFALGARQRCC